MFQVLLTAIEIQPSGKYNQSQTLLNLHRKGIYHSIDTENILIMLLLSLSDGISK